MASLSLNAYVYRHVRIPSDEMHPHIFIKCVSLNSCWQRKVPVAAVHFWE